MKKCLVIVGFVVILTGCASLEEGGFLTPQPVTSEYFKTTMGGFNLDTGKPGIESRYAIALDVLKSLPKGVLLEFVFENPENTKLPIVVNRKAEPQETEIYVESPEVNGVQSYQGYVILVNVYEDETKQNLIGTHRQVIQSIYDEATVRRMIKRNEKQ